MSAGSFRFVEGAPGDLSFLARGPTAEGALAAGGLPPQRHIPRSRSLGTTWWELQESDFSIRVEHVASWDGIGGPTHEQRRQWDRYESKLD